MLHALHLWGLDGEELLILSPLRSSCDGSFGRKSPSTSTQKVLVEVKLRISLLPDLIFSVSTVDPSTFISQSEILW